MFFITKLIFIYAAILNPYRIDGKVVSVYRAVISIVTDFDFPVLFLNGSQYLKEIIIFLYFELKVEKVDSQKFFLLFQSVNLVA